MANGLDGDQPSPPNSLTLPQALSRLRLTCAFLGSLGTGSDCEHAELARDGDSYDAFALSSVTSGLSARSVEDKVDLVPSNIAATFSSRFAASPVNLPPALAMR